MSGSRLVAIGVLIFLPTVVSQAARGAGESPAGTGPAPVDFGAGKYAGSAACERCHDTVYAAWTGSMHVQMTRPIAEARVIGDFSPGAHLERYGRAYRMSRRDGRYYISVSHQWIDYKEITPLPADMSHEFRQIWNVNCFNCHATNLAQNFDVAARAYATSWTEMGIGCEACHGPGAAHVELTRDWEADPTSKPAYDTSARNRDLGRVLKIFSPRSADKRQIFDTCAYCHGNKTNYFVGMKPGDRYEDYALPFLVSEPIPPEDPQGDFWPDGRPTRFNRPQALMQSGCFLKGQATCTSCHSIHASKYPHSLKVPASQTDQLCTQCHQQFTGPALEAHSRHTAASPGSRCVDCHMSEVNWRMLMRRRDHTFAPPVPEMTARYGVPNACTSCHDERSPEWAVRLMDQWYGDQARRDDVVRVADALYAAGSGDAAALPQLAALAVDRRKGAPIRASAAEFIARIAEAMSTGPDTAAALAPVVNALVGAAADPEPMVRVMATRALAVASEQTGDRQRLPALTARLVDPVRLVRATAGAALLRLGVTALDGAAGAALTRAQDEYAAMLLTFPDSAANHASLAWLEMARGRTADAERAIAHALALDPNNPDPHVLRGVLLARQEHLTDAIKAWKLAQKLDPKDPRPERLITEAEKRLRH